MVKDRHQEFFRETIVKSSKILSDKSAFNDEILSLMSRRRSILKMVQFKRSSARIDTLYFLVAASLLSNFILSGYFYHCSSFDGSEGLLTKFRLLTLSKYPLSTIERSTGALKQLKNLLNSTRQFGDHPWIWESSDNYPSVPYQITDFLNETIPKSLNNKTNPTVLPQCVKKEIDRICQRLLRLNSTGGQIWCHLFNQSYSDTLLRTTQLLDDGTTFIITGDIDLMWLRDSSAQVHQYLPLANDSEIQRIIEGLIHRQTEFIFNDPYGSAFRLTLRPNPPSDDSLLPIHVKKGRNLRVAMHNFELDSSCYYLRLSYSWWKQSRRHRVFDQRWLLAVSILVELMIVEQHHSQISPYRYTELPNNYSGTPVAYTGMIWSGFRPSDDPTMYGYLIPSNMMASVVLQQLAEMIEDLFPQKIELLEQIYQLRVDILAGINTYGVVKHERFGRIYAFETNGFGQHLLIDDANIPSLLSASYLNFKTPFDPDDDLILSTRKFILSENNRLFFKGPIASGIGSDHTNHQYVWPMSIIMEGLIIEKTNKNNSILDSVWTRLETSHVGTFAMHESFSVNNPRQFSRSWFAWADSLLAELILTHLDQLEDWLTHRRISETRQIQNISSVIQKLQQSHRKLNKTH